VAPNGERLFYNTFIDSVSGLILSVVLLQELRIQNACNVDMMEHERM